MTEVDLPTSIDAGLLIIRMLVGTVFAGHGFQKLFGWLGGGGLAATAGWFKSLGFGDGRTAAIMAGVTEIAGGLGLAIGLLTPLAAAGVIGVMVVAAYQNAATKGFWSAGGGWELNWYLIAVAFGLATTGPGGWSLDAVLGSTMTGIGPGLAALGLGIGLGTLRWATRDTSQA